MKHSVPQPGSKAVTPFEIVDTVLNTFEHRRSYTPGMFEPLKPLCDKLGYQSVAIYISDDYPDRMHLETSFGSIEDLPYCIMHCHHGSLYDELAAQVADVPNIMSAQLFSHDRELGAIAVTCRDCKDSSAQELFSVLVKSLSMMAYLERIRTNVRRERAERDIFFAQSLASRLLISQLPKLKNLRLGVELIRSLEAGGDFYDFVPTADGGVIGFVGSCNGQGLRTVLEVSSIMRETHRSYQTTGTPSGTLKLVNEMLVKEQKRAHQASLCLFEVNTQKNSLRLAKAGRLGLLLCGPGTKLQNLSSFGSTFLGMTQNPNIHDEEFTFMPGQSLFFVTEGFYNSRNILGARPQLHWFYRAVEETLENKRRTKPLAKAIFHTLNTANDKHTRPPESMLALSVEFLDRRHNKKR